MWFLNNYLCYLGSADDSYHLSSCSNHTPHWARYAVWNKGTSFFKNWETYYRCIIINVHIQIRDRIWENPTFCRFHQNRDFAIFSIIYNYVWVTSLLSMSNYKHCTISEPTVLCNTATNIDGGKIACAHTHTIKNYSKCWVFKDLVIYGKPFFTIRWQCYIFIKTLHVVNEGIYQECITFILYKRLDDNIW